MRRCEEPSRRSRQWGNESSSNVACLVITFLTDRCAVWRPVDRLARKVKSVFASGSRYREEFPGAESLHDRSKRHRPGTTCTRWLSLRWFCRGRTPRVIILTNFVAVRFAADMISFLTVERAAARPVRSRPHTYSPFLPWNQSQNVLRYEIPAEFSCAISSRNPAIAIRWMPQKFRGRRQHAVRLADGISNDAYA